MLDRIDNAGGTHRYFMKLFHGATKDRFALVLLTALLAVRSVYLWSYPFFIEGDGYIYYQLLEGSRANLLHATGYIFFSLPAKFLAVSTGLEIATVLRYTQQIFSVCAVIFLYFALARLGPRWLSFLICLLIGLDTQLIAATGTTRPEFFQANLLMLLFGCATFALTARKSATKTLWYTATGALVVAGYITKYNSLPLLLLALIPVLDRGLNWKSRLQILAYSSLAGAVLFAVFLFGFHYRTTGSFHLNLEHGWIEILKLQNANIPILPENGIATKKYIILAEHFPNIGAGSGPWDKLDEISPEVRAPHRSEWLPLLASTDTQYVTSAYERVQASLKVQKNYYEPVSFFPIYYYLGLQEGEALLDQVFMEGIRKYPALYLSNVGTNFLGSTDFKSQYFPYLPVPGVYDPTPRFFQDSKAELFDSRKRVFKAVDWALIRPEDLSVHIWPGGAAVFSYFTFLKFFPTTLLWIFILGGLIAGSLLIARHGRLTPANILYFVSLLTLAGVMSFSAIIFVFRMKELILCQPLIYILSALSVSQWIKLVTRADRSIT